jgi:DNA-binding winged helix-turn-helix (wHTH) protein/Tol biopolymer transport system component
MAVQYWVGDFFVDLSRNQVTQKEQSQIIAPKALAVLTYLAENQGRVVSYDELFSKVWPDTVVTPNTLQRSIAQLRKVLGQDSKLESYIKTHAKQGYSLECDVRWHDETNSTKPNSSQINEVAEIHKSETQVENISDITNKPKPFGAVLRLISIVAGIAILGIIGYQYFTPKQATQLTFDTLRLLTATDDKEFDATYSPDGQYIVFHRYLDKQCVNKIWAKNIRTHKETQLTKGWGSYGRHSFSKDGKSLVFLATEACNQPATQKNCYDLVSLDFEKAIESPQDPSLILQCQNSYVKHPTWLNNGNVTLLHRTSDRWKLINYSISNNTSTDFYWLKEGNLISYAYSARDDIFAVVSIHNDGQHYIEILDSDGHVLSSHLIKRPPEIAKFRSISPSFDSLNKQLIFSTGSQLFTLSYEGDISKINLPFADKMGQPTFHPDGKRLLMIKGPYDNDIVLTPRNQIAQTNQAYSSFERSTRGEDYANFQPDGELIAFWSQRSGQQQLWISDGNGPQQLTHFPKDTYISGFDWATDGKSLLVNVSGVLTQVFLDSTQQSFEFEHPVAVLFQWDSENNRALLIARIKGIYKFVEYDLNTSQIREITDKKILWALKSEDGRLIYKDHLDQFWQPGPAEAQLIKPLSKLGGKAKSFVINNNVIFAINDENQLWSYDLNTAKFEILGKVSEDVEYLTDANQTDFLMTVVVSAKKEVVELFLSE